ncbi:uncharacterized protein [Dendrobates tinctorius]|uniref:uncharacterized protein n=1 Tax=Dendrobates tinctorius TaxID=92724 RepID=UPI003CCA49FD
MGAASDRPLCHQTQPASEEVLLIKPRGKPVGSRRSANPVAVQTELCLSPSSVNPGSGKKDKRRASQSNPHSPVLAKKTVVFTTTNDVSLGPVGTARNSRFISSGADIPQTSQGVPSDGVEIERALLRDKGFSQGLVTTLIKSRKPITTNIYGRTWKKFLQFLGKPLGQEPPIESILEFLQAGLQLGLAVNTLKVQVSALGALYNCNIAANRWVGRFIKSCHRSRPVSLPKIAPWDLNLDKELNNYIMRCREWYGWHFPELGKVITDNLAYCKCVRAVGDRVNYATFDLSEILTEEVEAEVKAAAEISMGTEVSEEDINNILHLCDQVIEITEYRTQLYDYLKNRMMAIAPNLTVLVGELVGARLIAHAGSLLNLAKHPASTVQILGAEKALFRALKTKRDTPKYGLLYHASLVGQTAPKNKGKISRMLAAKSALAIRYDALGEDTNAQLGVETRAKLEARLRNLEERGLKRISGSGKALARAEKYQHKSEVRTYDPSGDSTLPSVPKKRKIEEVEEEEEQPSEVRVKKAKKPKIEEVEEEEEEQPSVVRVKKAKKPKVEEEEEQPCEVRAKKAKKQKIQPVEEVEEEPEVEETPKKKKKKKKVIKTEEEEEPEEAPTASTVDEPPKKKKKKKVKKEEDDDDDDDDD